jgi:putative phosphoesterase
MNRIAVLSDIHGNLPALEAVVADVARRNVDRVLNLGDHASGPLWPRETILYIQQQPWVNLSGNCDHAILQQPIVEQRASHRYAYGQLTSAELEWLRALPATVSLEEEILLFHGIPADNDVYLLETVERGEPRLARPTEIKARLDGVNAPVMLCGHTHVPRVVQLDDTLIVNPGSVGLQGYDHITPEYHYMQVGSPHARYALLARSAQGWQVEIVALEYDYLAAAEQAKRNARPDWERALRTGFMLD